MAIVQISKIQHRSGNLVDLPQLDEAELGWATDAKQLYIGKTTPNENIEVLTSYSRISFSQIEGSVGNLNINPVTVQNGQVLAFDGTNWVNKGGIAGGLITLGDVDNVKIDGGAIGYVLETDGTGNLSWTPKGILVAYIQNITTANPGVLTTTDPNQFDNGMKVTVTGAQGMTDVNGKSYYANIINDTSFSLYEDADLITPLDTSGFNAYSYTTVTDTAASTNIITVGDTAQFTVNRPVEFVGDLANTGISTGTTYYVYDLPVGGTQLIIATSADGNIANVVPLQNTTGLSAAVYEAGGRVISSLVSSGSTAATAYGSNTTVQFNNQGQMYSSSNFKFDYATNILTVTGNANVTNMNASSNVAASRLISNIATGNAPLLVSSTTRVANLNVDRANIADSTAVNAQSTGLFYPAMASGNATGNYTLGSNSNLSFNVDTGLLSAGGITVSGNATSNNLSVGNIANIGGALNVSGNVTAPILISNTAPGAAPLQVTSTTRVANLNVSYSNVSDFGVVTAQTTGLYYPVMVNNNTTGNYALAANGLMSFDVANGTLNSTGVNASGNVSANNLSIGNIANIGSNLNVTGNLAVTETANISGNLNVTKNGTITANLSANNLSIGNIANVGSNLSVGGNLSVTNSLTANGNIAFTGTNVSLGAIGNVKITGGTSGYVLTTDGTGNLAFSNPGAVVSAPSGSNTQVQFNDNGAMNASANFTFNKSTNLLTITGNANVTANLTANNISTGNIANIGANLLVGGVANIGGNLIARANAFISANANVTGNLNVTANANVTGNINVTGQFNGNGAGLTNIPGGNVSGTVANAAYATSAGNAANATLAATATKVAVALKTSEVDAFYPTFVSGNSSSVDLNIDSAMSFVPATNTLTVPNITSSGTISPDTLNVASIANVGANLNVSGNVNISLSGKITGALEVSGATALKNGLTVTGATGVSGNITTPRFISNIASGTAPLQVLSTTRVANLNVANAGYADSAGSASSVAWTNVSDRPTNVSSFNNDSGYLTTGSFTTGSNPVSGGTGYWCKLPNGMTLQWGTTTCYQDTTTTVYFPTAFATAQVSAVISGGGKVDGDASENGAMVTFVSRTYFQFFEQENLSTTCWWMAMGF